MILGIGTDIVEISRIEKACLRDSFLNGAYTKKELERSGGSISFLAGCFTAKEALAKCLGSGVRGFELSDIEILRDPNGKPYANIYNNARNIYRALGGERVHVSISDTKDTVIAFAIIEGKGDTDG